MSSDFTRHRDRDFEVSKWRNKKKEINNNNSGERRPQYRYSGKIHQELVANVDIEVKP